MPEEHDIARSDVAARAEKAKAEFDTLLAELNAKESEFIGYQNAARARLAGLQGEYKALMDLVSESKKEPKSDYAEGAV